MTTHYTAWLANVDSVLDGTQTDIAVTIDEIHGYDVDDEGNETPVWTSTSELAMDPVETGVELDDEDCDSKSVRAAERILAEHGFTVISGWDYTDNALTADVERND